MDKFTASNGVEVWRDKKDSVLTNNWVTSDAVGSEDAEALREFFQAERDEELGRWRWPEDSRFVVYPGYSPGEEQRFVRVVEEYTGVSTLVYESQKDGVRSHIVAAAYFEAHPERKPWHSAEAGEIWVLSIDESEDIPCIVTPSGPDFEPISHPVWATFARGSERITAARRIFPEVS